MTGSTKAVHVLSLEVSCSLILSHICEHVSSKYQLYVDIYWQPYCQYQPFIGGIQMIPRGGGRECSGFPKLYSKFRVYLKEHKPVFNTKFMLLWRKCQIINGNQFLILSGIDFATTAAEMHLKMYKISPYYMSPDILIYICTGFNVDMLLKKKCRYIGNILTNDETSSYHVHVTMHVKDP